MIVNGVGSVATQPIQKTHAVSFDMYNWNMKAPAKQSWALMSVLLAAFWLLPLISMWINRLSDPNAKWFIALLFLVDERYLFGLRCRR